MTFRGFKCAHTPDMAMCLDFDKGTYYLGGVQKKLSDFTAVSTGYTSTDMSWLPDGAFTVLVESSLPDTGLVATPQTLFTLTGSGSNRFEIKVKIQGNEEGNGNLYFGPHAGEYFPTGNQRFLGRKRFIVSYAPGQPLLLAQDCEPVRTVANTASLGPLTKWAVGLNGWSDTQVAQATIHKVHVWSGYRTVAGVEALADFWDTRSRPLLIGGSSLNNDQLYADGGGLWGRVARAVKNDGYVPFRKIAVGGTTPGQQATLYASLPARYRKFNYLSAEIGLGEAPGSVPGVEYLAAIETIRGIIDPAADWRLVEPTYAVNMRKATPENGLPADDANRIYRDTSWNATVAVAWPNRIIYTKDLMQAADPDDADMLTYDVWPQSLSSDGIHLNAAGAEALAANAGGMKDQLRAQRWV